jgi:hypothetical protein
MGRVQVKPLEVIKAVVTVAHRYTCHRCGESEMGDPMRVTVHHTTPDELATELHKCTQSAAYMPAGWGRFADGFRCPTCIKALDEVLS